MANFPTINPKFLVFVGIALAILFVGGYIVNEKTVGCDVGSSRDENGNCFYTSAVCRGGEFKVSDTCYYHEHGDMETQLIRVVSYFVIALFLSLVLVYFYQKNKLRSTQSIAQFPKKDFVTPKDAKDCVMEYFMDAYDIPSFRNKKGELQIDRAAFRFYKISRPIQQPSNKEWLWKFQLRIMKGTMQGIFAGTVSLSRGKDWIRTGMISWDDGLSENVKRNLYSEPYSVPENMNDRYLQLLEQSNPEKLEEYLEKNAGAEPVTSQPGTISPDAVANAQNLDANWEGAGRRGTHPILRRPTRRRRYY